MSDHPNGPYHFYPDVNPSGNPRVCEVVFNWVWFVDEENPRHIKHYKGRLVRLIEVEQNQPSPEPTYTPLAAQPATPEYDQAWLATHADGRTDEVSGDGKWLAGLGVEGEGSE